jgi:hypothetical protein
MNKEATIYGFFTFFSTIIQGITTGTMYLDFIRSSFHAATIPKLSAFSSATILEIHQIIDMRLLCYSICHASKRQPNTTTTTETPTTPTPMETISEATTALPMATSKNNLMLASRKILIA